MMRRGGKEWEGKGNDEDSQDCKIAYFIELLN